MKFALITHLPWPEDTNARSIVEQTIEDVALGEALGFHSAWLAEHHFTRYGIGSSVLVFASAIAARTSKIRLGTAVIVPPLHNPIRLAEDTATLDLISDGRLDAGFGRGASKSEFTPYGVDHSDTQASFQESVNMIRGMWTTPEYTHEGNHYAVHSANLVPQPVQRPHPPIYIAATRTPETLEFAVNNGFPTMIGLTVDTGPAIELCHRYEAMSAEAGTQCNHGRHPVLPLHLPRGDGREGARGSVQVAELGDRPAAMARHPQRRERGKRQHRGMAQDARRAVADIRACGGASLDYRDAGAVRRGR